MFVYLTICKVNNKKYIGKYEGNEKDNYLGSGKLLKRAITKYGVEHFERVILERYNLKEECREGEKKWIKLFNAVESKEFYNIALGGEGGNTFAGIQGEARILLIAKLKKRKRGQIKKDITSYWNVREKKIVKATREEFMLNKLLIGNNCKGLYITPAGVFCSRLTASKQNNNLDMTSLAKRCKNNKTTITKAHIATDKGLTFDDLEKNFSDLGYGFISKENITEEFLINNIIIK